MGINPNNKKIAKNTFALYTRNLVSLFIGLFTVRIILKNLGEEDYGIYTVVGGLLSFLTFISGALATGSQRFFSYILGKGNVGDLKITFGVTLTIYLCLAFIILIVGEFVGIWFINNHMNIPPERLFAANVVFQFVMISTTISLMAAPYQTAIMAHEDMHIFGRMTIIDAAIKILICVMIVVIPWDKLISYSFMLMLASIIIQIVYFVIAWRKYEECKTGIILNKTTAKEITAFSGWNLFGSLAWVTKNQGAAVMLNMFFGPAVNAAQGIASTVRNVSGTFSNGFSSAISPQIVKKYAVEDYDGLSVLLYRGSKITYYLMLILIVPLIFCIDYILDLWLGNHTQYMATFCQLLLLEALIDSVSSPLAAVNQATGKIGLYQALIGIFGLLTLPISYLFLRLGFPASIVFIVSLILQVFIVGVRLLFLHRIYPGALRGAFRYIVLPCLIVSLVVFGSCILLYIHVNSLLSLTYSCLLYEAICLTSIWLFGLGKNDRQKLSDVINKLVHHYV